MGEISPNLLLKPESIRNFIQLPGFLLLQKSLFLLREVSNLLYSDIPRNLILDVARVRVQ